LTSQEYQSVALTNKYPTAHRRALRRTVRTGERGRSTTLHESDRLAYSVRDFGETKIDDLTSNFPVAASARVIMIIARLQIAVDQPWAAAATSARVTWIRNFEGLFALSDPLA